MSVTDELLANARRYTETFEKGDLPLLIEGTEFQRRLWQALCEIPRGTTRTYGELAKRLEVDARAIGQACGDNRLPIVIPCHRVVAANGIGGFAGWGGILYTLAHLGALWDEPGLFAEARDLAATVLGLIEQRTGEKPEKVPTVRARISAVNGESIDYQSTEVRQNQGQVGREFAETTTHFQDALNDVLAAGKKLF